MIRRLNLLVAVIALAPCLAMAQATPPTTPATGEAATAPRPRPPAVRADQLEIRIKDLHTRLRITSAQEPQWTAFADVMRANARQMGELYQTGNPQTMTAVDALQHYAKIAQAHSGEITGLVAPFQSLYDSMSPAQKKQADEAFHSFGRRDRARG